MENYLEKIKICGFKKFENIEVNFNKRWNFIVGDNGCGKTSILRAIALSLSNSGNDYRCRENFNLELYIKIDNKRMKVGFKHDTNSGKLINNYGHQPSISYRALPKEEGTETHYYHEYKEVPPLIIGAYRSVNYKKITGMQREETVDQARNYYKQNGANFLSSSITPDIKQWMINRYFQIEKEWAEIEKKNWIYLVKKIEEISPKGTTFKFERIERELEPIFSINGAECYLEELSSGFKSILAILLEIFEWIEKVNVGEDRIVKNATGTVLIDEIDAHLHPEWQLIIADALKGIFPKLQFIITTHSPHVISSAKVGELLILKNDVQKLTPINKSYSGWSTDDILKDIMGVENLTNKDYNRTLEKCLEYIQGKDTKNLEKTIKQLKKMAHSNDTIVQTLEIKLLTLKLGEIDD